MVAKKTDSTKKEKEAPKLAKNEVNIYSLSGKQTGTEDLQKEMFELKDNPELIAQYVRVYLYNQRQGTVSSQTRSEVTGTSQKVYRQKGTGRARHGAAKANLFRGGGVTFGPKPREFSMSLNKKQKLKALFVSLSQKAISKNIRLLDTTEIGKKPQTKTVVQFLKETELVDKKVLFVLSKMEKSPFVLSTQNIGKVDVIQASTINPYQILNHSELVFVDDALKALDSHFRKQHEN